MVGIECLFTAFALIMAVSSSKEDMPDLSDILSSYDVLHHSDLGSRRVRRSVDGNKDITQISVNTLGRQFHLELQKSHEILSSGFKVVSIDKHDKKRVVEDLNIEIFKGKLAGDDNSRVEAHFEVDGGEHNLVATIQTKKEVYVIEPSWRHLPASSNYSMIAYKGSDLKFRDRLGPSYCGFVQPEGDGAAYSNRTEDEQEEESHDDNESPADRYRRQASPTTPRKNTCSLLLVADYRFYKAMGQGSLSKTITYLISLVHRIDQIYRNTQFGNYIDMGFGIKEIHVHEEWTVVAGGQEHYNEERPKPWPTKLLLEVFSRNRDFRTVCLAHLFTHQPFEGGVLGLAYISAPRDYSVGGVCTQAYYKGSHTLYLNTGWSSSLNRYNRRLLTQEADLVTTHEFGHNWGSEHDPDTTECSPNSFNGGKHIMYTYSVSGYDPNNHVFSPCSKRSMGAVLQKKSSKCFSERMHGYCGNALVESGEECDPGPQSVGVDGDNCCTSECKLRAGKQCSDQNDECCRQCLYAAVNTVCHEAQDQSCEDTSSCTGNSKQCPAPDHKANGSPCIGRGKCVDGLCQAYCESIDKISCACDDVSTSCKWCCRDNNNSTCKPDLGTSGMTENLPNGMPCVQGYCQEGVCEKQIQDLVQRFWDIIEQLGPNYIVAFMKANIVGTVIILSLFIWIPASCIVWRIDKKRELDEKQRMDWLNNSNNTLVLDPNRSRIRTTNRVQPRRRELMSVRDPVVRPGVQYTPNQPVHNRFGPPHGQQATYI